MQQSVVVAYVQPSMQVQRPYFGTKIRRGKLKVFRGGRPVREREQILAMAGRKV